MSNEDIKMSKLLSLPVKRTEGGMMPFLKDANGEVIFVGDGYHVDAAVHAINNHDQMALRIKELEAELSETLEEAIGWLQTSIKGDRYFIGDCEMTTEVNNLKRDVAKALEQSK